MEITPSQKHLVTAPFLQNSFATMPLRRAIAYTLTIMAECYNRPLQTDTISSYCTMLEDLDPQALAMGFSRALREELFFPPPARIRVLAGSSPYSDLIESMAKLELQWLLARIRKHGVHGQPAGGEWVLDGDQSFGPRMKCVKEPEGAPELTPLLEQALGYLGGNGCALTLLALHPVLTGWSDERSLFTAEKIERRWLDAYRLAYRGTEEL